MIKLDRSLGHHFDTKFKQKETPSPNSWDKGSFTRVTVGVQPVGRNQSIRHMMEEIIYLLQLPLIITGKAYEIDKSFVPARVNKTKPEIVPPGQSATSRARAAPARVDFMTCV
jgi:hypothetical protein